MEQLQHNEEIKKSLETTNITEEKIHEYDQKIEGYKEEREGFQQEEKNLKNEIEKGPRPVETLKNGNIRIPYDWKGTKWNFDIDPRTNNVIVRKYTKIPAIQNMGRKVQDIVPVDISSAQALNKDMGEILNKYIGTERPHIPHKTEEARNLLSDSIDAYTENDFERNEEEQKLSYVYLLGSQKGSVITLQKNNNTITLTMETHNEYGAGSNETTKSIPLTNINAIPDTIYQHFAKGIDLKTYFDITIDDDYKPNEHLLKKIKQKAQVATNIIKNKLSID